MNEGKNAKKMLRILVPGNLKKMHLGCPVTLYLN